MSDLKGHIGCTLDPYGNHLAPCRSVGTEVHVCRFSSLDHLTKKQLKNNRLVLSVLQRSGRFSYWEVSERKEIAQAISGLEHHGYIETGQAEFPWYTAKLTEKGEAARSILKGLES